MGSISIQAWALACAAMILLVSDAMRALIALLLGADGSTAQTDRGEWMKLAGEKTDGSKTKEL